MCRNIVVTSAERNWNGIQSSFMAAKNQGMMKSDGIKGKSKASKKQKPKKPRKNSEKRKEKSRDAARCRRSKETDYFNELAESLPLAKTSGKELDKASIMRLVISYLKTREVVENANPIAEEQCNATTPEDLLMQSSVFLKAMEGFLVILSEEGDLVYVSENVGKFLGLNQVDLMGQSIFDYSHPCDHDEIREALALKKDPNKPVSLFVRMKSTLTSKGKTVNLKTATYKVIQISGQILSFDKVQPVQQEAAEDGDSDSEYEDLAPQQEEPRFMRKNNLMGLCEPIPHPSNIDVPLDNQTFISRHGMDMRFTYVDNSITSVLGYSAEEMIGKTLYEFFHAADSKALEKSFKILVTKGQCETPPYRLLTKNGGYAWVLSQSTVIYGAKSTKPEFVVSITYILSGIEHADEIISLPQLTSALALAAQSPEVIAPAPPVVQITQKRKRASSDKKSNDEEANTNDGNVTRELDLTEELEDLTHLAPVAGEDCVSINVDSLLKSYSNLFEGDLELGNGFNAAEAFRDMFILSDDVATQQQQTEHKMFDNDPFLLVSCCKEEQPTNGRSRSGSNSDSSDGISTDASPSPGLSDETDDQLIALTELFASTHEAANARDIDSMIRDTGSLLSDSSDSAIECDEFDTSFMDLPLAIEPVWESPDDFYSCDNSNIANNKRMGNDGSKALAEFLRNKNAQKDPSRSILQPLNDRNDGWSTNNDNGPYNPCLSQTLRAMLDDEGNDHYRKGGGENNGGTKAQSHLRAHLLHTPPPRANNRPQQPNNPNSNGHQQARNYALNQQQSKPYDHNEEVFKPPPLPDKRGAESKDGIDVMAAAKKPRFVDSSQSVCRTKTVQDENKVIPDVLKDSVLLNLLISGQDISNGYSCITGPTSNNKATMIKPANSDLMFGGMEKQGFNPLTDPGYQPTEETIPLLLNITSLDAEVNAPIYATDGLLQGQELLSALDQTFGSEDSCYL